MWRASSHTRIVIGRVPRTILARLGTVGFHNAVFRWGFIFTAISGTCLVHSETVRFAPLKFKRTYLELDGWRLGRVTAKATRSSTAKPVQLTVRRVRVGTTQELGNRFVKAQAQVPTDRCFRSALVGGGHLCCI